MGFGGMMVRADRARDVISRDRRVRASASGSAIDARDEVRNVLLAAAVPEAEHKSWVDRDPGNSMSMPMSMPHAPTSRPSSRCARDAPISTSPGRSIASTPNFAGRSSWPARCSSATRGGSDAAFAVVAARSGRVAAGSPPYNSSPTAVEVSQVYGHAAAGALGTKLPWSSSKRDARCAVSGVGRV